MEALFQIRSRTDFADLGRLYRYLFLFNPRNLWLCGAYLLICSFAASWFFASDDPFSAAVIVLVFLIFVILILVRCFSTLENHKKRIRESHHTEYVDSTYDVFLDAIQAVDSTGANARLLYDSIRYAKDRPEEILLMTKARLVYVLPKNAFVKGSPEDFLVFLQSRSVKVKA